MVLFSKKFFYIPLLILILLSGTYIQVKYFSIAYLLGMFVLFLLNLDFVKFKYNYLSNAIGLLFFISILLFINYFFSKSYYLGDYFVLLMQVILTLITYFTLIIHKCDIPCMLFKLLRVIIIYSLIGFVLSHFISGKLVLVNDNLTVYVLFPFFKKSVEKIAGLSIWRNQGFFWEPGIMMIYSNLFLSISLFTKKYWSKKNILLGLVAVFSTLSTTGFAIMALQLCIYLFKTKISQIKKIILFFCVILIGIIAIISLRDKISVSKESDLSSYGLRMLDITDSIYVIKNNPIFGIGLNKDIYIKEKPKYVESQDLDFFRDRGNSNGVFTLLYQLGIIFFIYYLKILKKQRLIESDSRLTILFVFLICLCNEPLILTPFFLFFPLSAFNLEKDNYVRIV